MSNAQFPEEQSAEGEFQRQEDEFRDWIGEDQYPPNHGRYHLYVSFACPWANRTMIVRKLKGLENVVGMTIVDPIRDERGWAFRPEPDPVNGFSFLAEAYRATAANFAGRVTVPVLWDKERKRIVNNSEDDICRMFNDRFEPVVPNQPNLFPPETEQEQAELSQYIYEKVNNGVYRAGFASKQRAYERSCRELFAAFDELDRRLETRRYLFGPKFVETDWRLFCTLIRFDAVYHGHFKCNLRRIVDCPNLDGYLRDLYQHPGIAGLVDFDHIKRHYYMTHEEINPTRIVPIGPQLELMRPHGRERLG